MIYLMYIDASDGISCWLFPSKESRDELYQTFVESGDKNSVYRGHTAEEPPTYINMEECNRRYHRFFEKVARVTARGKVKYLKVSKKEG
jgi:hypothetical protein